MSTLDERTNKLCASELFAGLDQSSLKRIAGIMTDFDARAGQVLMRSGEAGAGMLIVEEGSVVVSLRGHDVELGAGECIGELALLDAGGKHVARVRAKTDVQGYAIDRDHFIEMLEDEPKIALALLRILAHRLADVVPT
jgi:CRP-like cAMP-binding protein